MKKLIQVSIVSFIFLLVASITAFGLSFVDYDRATIFLAIGIGIIVVSGIASIWGDKRTWLNAICFVLCAIALGCCIRAWYLYRGFENHLWILALVSLSCVVYLWIFYALSLIKPFQNHFRAFFWTMFLLSLVAYVLIVIFTKTTYVSTFGYYMIVEVSFMFPLYAKSSSNKQTFRHITLATLSVFVVAGLIAIFMASGEFDGAFIDCFTGTNNEEKKQKKMLNPKIKK